MSVDATTLERRITAAIDDLALAQDELERVTAAAVDAERTYKMARATKYVQTHGTVAEREAAVDMSVSEVRYAAHLADGMRAAGLEAVRNHRSVLSAFQTLARLATEEAAFARTGPEVAA